MKPGVRYALILAGVVIVTFALALAVARRHRLAQLSPAPSTFNASPYGLKAVYTMLDRLGRPVERWQHPWTKLAGRNGLLVYADVSLDELYITRRARWPTDEECLALARWIARGNHALIYASADSADQLAGLFDKLGLRHPATNGVCRVDRRPTKQELFEPPWRETVTLSAVMPATFTRDVRQLHIARAPGLRPERGAYVPLVAGESSSLHALWLKHDRGQALVFSSASFIDNEFIAQQDNLALLLNTLRGLAGDGAILFDEFHHGYSREFAAHDFLRLPMVKFAAAQLALLTGLLILSQWRRFGQPVPLLRQTPRSVMEYAVSLGDLYARAETQLEALDYLYKNLRQELADRPGRANRQAWEKLSADCEGHLQTRRLSRSQFAELARRIQQLRRQLR
jgi:hypothetical protein